MPSYKEDARRQKIIAPDGTEIFSEIPIIKPESGPFEGKRSAETDDAFVTVSSRFLKQDSIPPTFHTGTNLRYVGTNECGLEYSWLRLDGWENDGKHIGWTSGLKLSVNDKDIPALREHLEQQLRHLNTITPAVDADKNLKTLGVAGKILYLDQSQQTK